ncbi:hypothetical protein, partial [Streptomyces sp. NPDC051561]|uniref:hypothetical protein n=1 Tax=Streptomyces sp. NPDC051561 TaxID=3365658 RepID=UPI003787E75E
CSVLAFPTLSDRFRSDFLGAFQVLRFRVFPFRRFRLYQKHFGRANRLRDSERESEEALNGIDIPGERARD